MAISRMQEPRQLYGLGSLVKSIGKTIKKVVKSPIGKAALLVGGAGLAGFGPAAGLRGTALGNALFGGATKFLPGATAAMKGAAVSSPGLFGAAKNFLGGLSTGTKLGIGGALTSYLASSGMDQEEIAEIENDPEKLKMYLKDYYSKTNPDATDVEVEEFVRINSAIGGRVGLKKGTPKPKFDEEEYFRRIAEEDRKSKEDEDYIRKIIDPENMAMGGMPTGIMRTNKVGTIERDYRETGGFVPVGIKEKADDVPAMLSKNEFVMTADAVRGIGDGNIEKGAQRLYDQMKQAEKRVV